MAASNGVVRINTKLDTTGFNTGMSQIMSGLKSIAGAVGLAFGVASLVRFGKECINLSSDLAEVDNVVSKSFGNLRGQMDALANESIKTLGMSRLTAYQTGATFMSMGKAMLDDQQAAADMAIELTKLTGNMSSFYNKSQDLVSIALKSVYTGETETLKQYGIVMTEVNLEQFALEQGITKSYKAMSQAEKVQLRYNYVMAQTAFIGNDFLDTQDSWANQTRILSEQWKEFMTIIGNGLVTVLTPVIRVLNTIVSALITFANAVGTVMSKLFGIKGQTFGVAESAENAAGGYEDMADNASDAGKAATKAGKAAKGALAGFDDLNVLQQKSGSGSGGAGGGGGSEITAEDVPVEEIAETNPMLDALKSRLLEIKDLIAEGFWDGLGNVNLDSAKASIESIKDSIKNIFTDPEVQSAANNMIDAWAYSIGQQAGSMASIGITIATNLLGGIAKYLEQNTERIKDYIIDMFDISARVAEIKGNYAVAVADVFSVFGGDTAQQITADIIGIFADTFMGITELTAQFGADMLDLMTRPFIENTEGIKTALEGMLENVQTMTGAIKETIDTFVDDLLGMYEAHFAPLFDSLANGLSELAGEFLDFWNGQVQPVLDRMAEKFAEMWTAHLSPLLTKVTEFLGVVADGIKALWEGVLQPMISWFIETILPTFLPIIETLYNAFIDTINGIIDTIGFIIEIFTGLINFIIGIFTGDWQRAWEGIKQIFTAAWNAIKTAVSTIFTAIKGVIDTILLSIKTAITNRLNLIKTTWTNVFTALKTVTTTIFTGIWNAIKGTINSILSGIEAMANGVVNGINKIIDAMNGLSFDIPDWVPEFGGKTFGFNIPKLSTVSLPRLATGGITTGATLAQIGEAGREAVLPLENNTGWMNDLAAMLTEKMSGANGGTVVLEIDGAEFGRVALPFINNEQTRLGVSMATN